MTWVDENLSLHGEMLGGLSAPQGEMLGGLSAPQGPGLGPVRSRVELKPG